MARTCTFHCAACGSHFHSLSSFDSHRQGVFSESRFCGDPEEMVREDGSRRLTAHTGVCRLARGGPFEGVEIWSEAGAAEKARAAFGRQAELENAA